MQVVILAGGLGTRIRSITKGKIPKVMLPIGNKPFLWYVLDYFRLQGIKDVILCVGFGKEMIKDYFKNGQKYGLNIIYSEEKIPLGTGGAIKNAAFFIKNNKFILANGDTLFKLNLKELIFFHDMHKAKVSMALKFLLNTSRYGTVEVSQNHEVTKFIEKGNTKPGYVNGGIYVINKEILRDINKFPCSFEKDILPQFVKRGLYGKVFEDYFMDIGIPDDYEKAKREIESF